MSRRFILGRRSDGQIGLFISKPGYDADLAAEADLLFSSSIRHAMFVGSGQVLLKDGGVASDFVTFPKNVGVAPIVFCGGFNPRPATAPAQAVAYPNGFYAYPKYNPFTNNYPAANTWVPWFAWMKATV